jgi:hypothetical protein
MSVKSGLLKWCFFVLQTLLPEHWEMVMNAGLSTKDIISFMLASKKAKVKKKQSWPCLTTVMLDYTLFNVSHIPPYIIPSRRSSSPT